MKGTFFRSVAIFFDHRWHTSVTNVYKCHFFLQHFWPNVMIFYDILCNLWGNISIIFPIISIMNHTFECKALICLDWGLAAAGPQASPWASLQSSRPSDATSLANLTRWAKRASRFRQVQILFYFFKSFFRLFEIHPVLWFIDNLTILADLMWCNAEGGEDQLGETLLPGRILGGHAAHHAIRYPKGLWNSESDHGWWHVLKAAFLGSMAAALWRA